MAIGSHIELQKEAAKTLRSNQPLTHEELKNSLGIDSREKMQAVVRGLQDNGALAVDRSGDDWKYTLYEDFELGDRY